MMPTQPQPPGTSVTARTVLPMASRAEVAAELLPKYPQAKACMEFRAVRCVGCYTRGNCIVAAAVILFQQHRAPERMALQSRLDQKSGFCPDLGQESQRQVAFKMLYGRRGARSATTLTVCHKSFVSDKRFRDNVANLQRLQTWSD